MQTGCGLTGTAWAYQQLGLAPDVVAFGKKTQVCGIMAGGRVDEVPDNVFAVSSRINSDLGRQPDRHGAGPAHPGGRRGRRADPAGGGAGRGACSPMLRDLAERHPAVTDPRGRGLMCAVTLATPELRDQVVERLRTDERVIVLGCGTRSLRFRPALTVTEDGAGGGRRGAGPGAGRPGTVTTWS